MDKKDTKTPENRLKTRFTMETCVRADNSIVNLNVGFPVLSFTTAISKSPNSPHRFSQKIVIISEFEFVSGKTQPGRDEGEMEDRKAAPALRARPLRSYVPLRCVRTKVRPPALPRPFPAEIFSSQF